MPAATRATASAAPTTGKVRNPSAVRRGRDPIACDVSPLHLMRASLPINRGNLFENGEGSGMTGKNAFLLLLLCWPPRPLKLAALA